MHVKLQSERERLENERTSNEMLDSPITENEIKQAIKSLKSNKACGPDRMTNEMLKFGVHSLLTPLGKVFLILYSPLVYILATGLRHISAQFIKKGPKTDPSDYRGISITSCVSKLNSSILNLRLTLFLDNKNIINDNQSGFRKKRRTDENLFIL